MSGREKLRGGADKSGAFIDTVKPKRELCRMIIVVTSAYSTLYSMSTVLTSLAKKKLLARAKEEGDAPRREKKEKKIPKDRTQQPRKNNNDICHAQSASPSLQTSFTVQYTVLYILKLKFVVIRQRILCFLRRWQHLFYPNTYTVCNPT